MNRLIKSFGFAFQGIFQLVKNERNFRIQFAFFILVLMASYLLKISRNEFIITLVCSMVVLSLEGINTAIEELCNLNESTINPKIKKIKDVAAGAVLIASICSFLIGLMIFLPHIQRLIDSL